MLGVSLLKHNIHIGNLIVYSLLVLDLIKTVFVKQKKRKKSSTTLSACVGNSHTILHCLSSVRHGTDKYSNVLF